MLIPHFWIKAEREIVRNNRNVSIVRWGWSNQSLDDAKTKALERCEAAIHKTPLKRREKDEEYGDTERPIKEEILYESNDPTPLIITRNRYGAHCLNSDTLAILDIDLPEHKLKTAHRNVLFLIALLSIGLIHFQLDMAWIASIVIVTAFYHVVLIPVLTFLWQQCTPSPEQKKYVELQGWARSNPDEKRNLRIYRTPAGLRVLLTHKPYEMNEDLWNIMTELGCDPLYVHLCKMQKCCRARLTAKPWRMINHPKMGRPTKDEHTRLAWIEQYDRDQDLYSSCQFIGSEGSNVIHDQLDYAIGYHDIASQALKDKMMA